MMAIVSFVFNNGCPVCGKRLELFNNQMVCKNALCAQVMKQKQIKRYTDRFLCSVCGHKITPLTFSGIEGYCAPCYFITDYLVSFTGLQMPERN